MREKSKDINSELKKKGGKACEVLILINEKVRIVISDIFLSYSEYITQNFRQNTDSTE